MIAGALARGLTLNDLKELTLGQVVDFCITYNEMNEPKQEEESEKVRQATQSDFDRF